ncbi:50S ribosomal protein L13 [Candidatus Peregrinibacteria bacterium]|nr:MAG: 50S ribosomal protein L13 [Candidatus Peregrinibacteria bacterium]
MQKTFTPKIQAKDDKKWFLIDAEGKVLGRLATEIANILRGKNKPSFTPHLDMGDYVVVINADKVVLTGKKEDQKEYIHHTGYLGHLRRRTASTIRERNPIRLITEAVSGMLPKNRLRPIYMKKFKAYAGSEHPHAGQALQTISL